MHGLILLLFCVLSLSFTQVDLDHHNHFSFDSAEKIEEDKIKACTESFLTKERVIQAIKRIKEVRANNKMGGVEFSHFKSSNFSLFDANIIKVHGKNIFPQNVEIDYSGCGNLICLWNRIYKTNDDGIYGYYLYYFYLRTGVLLATTNVYPMQYGSNPGEFHILKNRKEVLEKFDYDKYLFKKEHLENFIIVAEKFPQSYLYMVTISSVHKAPTDQFEIFRHQCAQAFDYGTLLINDTCLEQKNLISLFFHEFSHYKDFDLANEDQRFFSDNPEWLEFKGWNYASVCQNPRVEDCPVKIKRWVNKNGRDKFVSNYAMKGGFPSEDFAESLTAYMKKPSLLLAFDALLPKLTKPKYQKMTLKNTSSYDFLKEVVFEGKGYQIENLRKSSQQMIINKTRSQFSKIHDECATDEICASSKLENIISEQNKKLSRENIYYCEHSSSLKSPAYNFALQLESEVKKYINSSAEVKKEFDQLYNGAFSGDSISYLTYNICRGQDQFKSCWLKQQTKFVNSLKHKKQLEKILESDMTFSLEQFTNKNEAFASKELKPFLNLLHQATEKAVIECINLSDEGSDFDNTWYPVTIKNDISKCLKLKIVKNNSIVINLLSGRYKDLRDIQKSILKESFSAISRRKIQNIVKVYLSNERLQGSRISDTRPDRQGHAFRVLGKEKPKWTQGALEFRHLSQKCKDAYLEHMIEWYKFMDFTKDKVVDSLKSRSEVFCTTHLRRYINANKVFEDSKSFHVKKIESSVLERMFLDKKLSSYRRKKRKSRMIKRAKQIITKIKRDEIQKYFSAAEFLVINKYILDEIVKEYTELVSSRRVIDAL